MIMELKSRGQGPRGGCRASEKKIHNFGMVFNGITPIRNFVKISG
jgi:hypothetical protein